jgi:2-dehydro-3-deoxygalactonokinase
MMIAVNWGTSNFRAYKLDAKWHVEAEKSSDRGAITVPSGGFQDALMSEVLEWMDGNDNRILMCGMVGARRGWMEAPYVPVPATFEQVVKGVIQIEVEGLDVRIVPGLIGSDSNGVPDVLRGEETEVLGCQAEVVGNVQFCLPGTHTKWLRMEGGKLGSFLTSMTGDLFRAIRSGTILRSCTQHEPDDERAFLKGVARAGQGGELGHQLFGVRTLVLTGDMKESSASSYLSGLLIGNEVKQVSGKDGSIHLIGDGTLCVLYQKAMREFGVIATMEPEGAALRGLQRIGRSLKW